MHTHIDIYMMYIYKLVYIHSPPTFLTDVYQGYMSLGYKCESVSEYVRACMCTGGQEGKDVYQGDTSHGPIKATHHIGDMTHRTAPIVTPNTNHIGDMTHHIGDMSHGPMEAKKSLDLRGLSGKVIRLFLHATRDQPQSLESIARRIIGEKDLRYASMNRVFCTLSRVSFDEQ